MQNCVQVPVVLPAGLAERGPNNREAERAIAVDSMNHNRIWIVEFRRVCGEQKILHRPMFNGISWEFILKVYRCPMFART